MQSWHGVRVAVQLQCTDYLHASDSRCVATVSLQPSMFLNMLTAFHGCTRQAKGGTDGQSRAVPDGMLNKQQAFGAFDMKCN